MSEKTISMLPAVLAVQHPLQDSPGSERSKFYDLMVAGAAEGVAILNYKEHLFSRSSS